MWFNPTSQQWEDDATQGQQQGMAGANRYARGMMGYQGANPQTGYLGSPMTQTGANPYGFNPYTPSLIAGGGTNTPTQPGMLPVNTIHGGGTNTPTYTPGPMGPAQTISAGGTNTPTYTPSMGPPANPQTGWNPNGMTGMNGIGQISPGPGGVPQFTAAPNRYGQGWAGTDLSRRGGLYPGAQ